MERRHEKSLGETLFTGRLSAGLAVVVLPKPGWTRKYATFTTHYGSIDSEFVVPGEKEPTRVPDGIAHFLEHKLFEEPEGNVFDKFAALGANTNAYTYYNLTSYLFSCAENFSECLQTLVNFVLNPYFTDENVAKERGIIEQELRMYNDSPGWRVQSNLMEAMYHRHPVRIDIGGTVESIQKISRETLYRCYQTFYHPSNMVLFVVGDVDPEKVFSQVSGLIEPRGFASQAEIQRIYPKEPEEVDRPWVSEDMVVSQPIFRMGYKDAAVGLTGGDQLRREVLTEIVLEAVLGESAPLYQKIYEAGLIDESFEIGYEGHSQYGFSVMGGKTRDPERLQVLLLNGLRTISDRGLESEDFERIRNSRWGSFLRWFDHPDGLAFAFNSLHFKGASLFDYPAVLGSLSLEEANRRLREHFDPANHCVSVINPKD